MKKLILLLFIPYTLIAQNFKIEHKVNDDKTVDFSYRNLSANTVTVIVNFSFLENSMSSTKVVEKVSKPEGRLFKLKPANKEQNIGFNYSYLFFKILNPVKCIIRKHIFWMIHWNFNICFFIIASTIFF